MAADSTATAHVADTTSAGTTAGRYARRLPAALAGSVVALQIAYPLAEAGPRNALTVLIVIVFAAACVVHATVTRGPRLALVVLLLTAVPGYAAEVVGVDTGMPFGAYAYDESLGPKVLGVPPVVGLAWTMLAWPAAIVARHLVKGFAARVVVGAWALAVADLFLDPQMVDAGHWRWSDTTMHLPGAPGVPLSNYAGWLVVALVISLAVQSLLGGAPPADDTVPLGLYLWLYVGWIVALGGFLDLSAAAAWGALGMGTVAVPLALPRRR